MTTEPPQVITEWLANVRPAHRDLMTGLHNLLMTVEPEFSISLKWSNPAYALSGQTFIYLADQSDYVTLGFYNGAQMADPHGLVEGTGKRLRHIKVSKLGGEIEQKLIESVKASLAAGSDY